VCARVIQLATSLTTRAQLCRGCAASAPLASWDSANLDLDDRIAAGDATALFDLVVEAIAELSAIRDAIDSQIVVPAAGPLGGRGTLARLNDLQRRAACGMSLFGGDGRLGGRPEGAA
jgi:hypothetical protein